MKRFILALGFGVAITLLPWILRPLLRDRIAILWLPGFVAISPWFPHGLNGPNADAARVAGCTANAAIWTGIFLLISYSAKVGISKKQIR